MLEGADILITGGTGSLGRALTRHLIEMPLGPRRVVVFSRDELKQHDMAREYGATDQARLRFFLGDVRDKERLRRALCGVDYVVHAAAMKQVPACEYNPGEAVKTNVNGAMNIVEAAIDMGVKRVIALSTDKACNPINLYGSTKLAAEKIFSAGNALAGALDTRFAVVRYGNVVGSRGSVVPLFRKQAAEGGPITITDPRMTRFWITLPAAVAFVLKSLGLMEGGEVFVPKLPTVSVLELALAIAPAEMGRKVTGIRQGEKLHETLIGPDEAGHTFELDGFYVIVPNLDDPERWRGIRRLELGDVYSSDQNVWRLRQDVVSEMLGNVKEAA